MFLLRNTHPVVSDLPTISENKLSMDARTNPKSAVTLEGLMAGDSFSTENSDKDNNPSGGSTFHTSKYHTEIGNHSDVLENEGWITIPKSKVPDDWFDASNIQQLHSLDRSFVFSGEQLHLLVCLSAATQDEEVTSTFRTSGVISKSENSTQLSNDQNEASSNASFVSGKVDVNAGSSEYNDETLHVTEKRGSEQDATATKSFLGREDNKHQIETLLEKFRCSNFFVRIAESDEPLWYKRPSAESSSTNSDMAGGIFHAKDVAQRKESFLSAVIDQGKFDSNASGGMARDVRCYSLSNGDIVVLLQVNIATSNTKDPVLEVLQFEKYRASVPYDSSFDLHSSNHHDPCGELLNWLLPLDRTLPPHSFMPPLGQSPSVATHRPTSSYSGSPIFSFSQFRSYSMSSLPQDSVLPASATHSSKPSFDLEDLDCLAPEKLKNHDTENEGLLSFRGVSLVPERFSVHCGFEGIYLPGRRWCRKIEIIQPLEIHSFASSCTTEDLLCVQIKNVSPAHLPDITIFLDSITIVYDEPTRGSSPLCLPLASIETGDCHTLPNLPLRRGEEHSFIMKLVTQLEGNLNDHVLQSTALNSKIGTSAFGSTSKKSELKKTPRNTDQCAVLVSCRCNYTESKLFFKHRTSWRPRIAKDLIISVASEVSDRMPESTKIPQLPVQVLTLHASNLTSEDLNLTVTTSLSSASSPSAAPLNSEEGRLNRDRKSNLLTTVEQKANNDGDDGKGFTSDIISGTDRACTHLWLQSTVPLGVVPAHSSSSVKLELLPLTDGIITLDTLQVAAQDKGLTYVPEQPLKIYATSSIATGLA